jgi:hypothetical protein
VRDVISNYCPPSSAIPSASHGPLFGLVYFGTSCLMEFCSTMAAHRHSSLAAVAGSGAMDIGDGALAAGPSQRRPSCVWCGTQDAVSVSARAISTAVPRYCQKGRLNVSRGAAWLLPSARCVARARAWRGKAVSVHATLWRPQHRVASRLPGQGQCRQCHQMRSMAELIQHMARATDKLFLTVS